MAVEVRELPEGEDPGRTPVAFPLKAHNSPCTLQSYEEDLVDQLAPGIERLKQDMALLNLTPGEEAAMDNVHNT